MSLKNVLAHTAVAGVAGVMLVTCGPSPEEFQAISKKQDEILAKLEKDLIPKVDKIAARPAAPRPAAQPGRPDPSKVYAFPLGDSPIRGSKAAWVTIVEVSDFQ